jgi:hypothetical protein
VLPGTLPWAVPLVDVALYTQQQQQQQQQLMHQVMGLLQMQDMGLSASFKEWGKFLAASTGLGPGAVTAATPAILDAGWRAPTSPGSNSSSTGNSPHQVVHQLLQALPLLLAAAALLAVVAAGSAGYCH